MSETIVRIQEERDAANTYCDVLLEIYDQRMARKRNSLYISGAASLLSGAAITAALAPYIDGNAIKIGSAFLALVSAWITLRAAIFADDRDTRQILTGANTYMSIRRKADQFIFGPSVNDNSKQYKFYKIISDDMDLASRDYGSHIPWEKRRRTSREGSGRGNSTTIFTGGNV